MLECIDRSRTEPNICSIRAPEIVSSLKTTRSEMPGFCDPGEAQRFRTATLIFYDKLSDGMLLIEVPRLRRHLKTSNTDFDEARRWATLDFLTFIANWGFVRPLVMLTLALQVFLTLYVSVASCERSFSKLKLIKSHLRLTTLQSRLFELAVLPLDSKTAKCLDFDDVINSLAALQVRRRFYLHVHCYLPL